MLSKVSELAPVGRIPSRSGGCFGVYVSIISVVGLGFWLEIGVEISSESVTQALRRKIIPEHTVINREYIIE
jgi:hypothetical protein